MEEEYEEQEKNNQGERNEDIEKALGALSARNLFIVEPFILLRFFEKVKKELSLEIESFKISYANRYIRRDELPTDILGRDVLRCLPVSLEGQSILLLLDPFPGGNWAHPCLIGTWGPSMKEIEVVSNDFPPSQRDFRMVFYDYLFINRDNPYHSPMLGQWQ